MPVSAAFAQDTPQVSANVTWVPLAIVVAGLAIAATTFLLRRYFQGQRNMAAARIVENLDQGVALFEAGNRMIYANGRARDLIPQMVAATSASPAVEDFADACTSLLQRMASAFGKPLVSRLENGGRIEARIKLLNGGDRLLVLREIAAGDATERPADDRLEAMKVELERSYQDLDDFAHVASHDLKEPLRGISINANFLKRDAGLSDGGKDRVTRMIALCNRMEQLISDLLFFTRLSQSDRASEEVDTSEIIAGIRVSLTDLLGERCGTISIATEMPPVDADSTKIKTVFQHLIVNAIKYNDALRKVVTVGFLPSFESENGTLHDVFYVADNGIGIDETNREKIFRIFSRLNTEKAYGAGTGAGLAFVKKIVEDYGGEITFASNPGKGTTFYFSLPIARTTELPPRIPVRRAAG